MRFLFATGFAVAGLLLGANAADAAVTIDFTKASGFIAENAYAGQGISKLYLQTAAGVQSDVTAGVKDSIGLSNSILGKTGDHTRPTYPYYPTAEYMSFIFAAPVSDLSFFYEDHGASYTSTYTAYDADLNVVATGSLNDVDRQVSVSGADISALLISNGKPTSDWFFDVQSVSFDDSAAVVPEPASWAMFIGGFGLMGGMARRRRANVRFA